MARKKITFLPGDVFEIPLPNGKFAYGRVYDDAGVGIYRFSSDTPNNPPLGLRDFLFHVGMYEDILSEGEWSIVGRDEYREGESRFPPPSYIKDPITNTYSIYHKGEIWPAAESEIRGLEETAVWDSHHITERIMKTLESDVEIRK